MTDEKRIDVQRGDGFGPWLRPVIGFLLCGVLLYMNGGWSLFRSNHVMGFFEYYCVNTSSLLVVTFFALICGRQTFADYGLSRPSARLVLIAFTLVLLFFPFVNLTSKTLIFQQYYLGIMHQSGGLVTDQNEINKIDIYGLVVHQWILVTYMFAWEWFFRGYLLFSMEKIKGPLAAVLTQSVLFTVMHLGKPPLEVASSFFGAVILGVWTLRTRSVIPCFIVHAGLTVLNDLCILLNRP